MKDVPIEKRRGHYQVRKSREPLRQFCIRLEPSLFVRLQGLSKFEGMSIAAVASAALDEALQGRQHATP